MKTLTLTLLALAATHLSAEEKITTGPPKLEVEAGAQEGPSWDLAGWLYYVGRGQVSRLSWHPGATPGKVDVFLDKVANPNTSVVDPQGRVLVCEAGGRRVTRTGKDGVTEVLADNYEGKRLNSPNDISLDSKGRIYFTDPRYGRTDNMEIKDEAGKSIEGVYRIDAPGKITRILAHAVERPNGLLVSPDDRYLYVADNYNNRVGGARKLYRFGLKADGSIIPDSRVVIFDWKTARGPDGFKMDREGRLYVAAGRNRANQYETADEFKGGIYILSASGELLEFVPFEKDETTNCAFGGPDLKTLFVTSAGQLWSVPVSTPGRITAKR